MHAPTDCRQLRFGLRGVDVLAPPRLAGQWPCCQKFAISGGVTQPPPEAAPSPLFRPTREFGPQGIAFHVTADGVEMIVGLDRKGLEPALVKMAGTGSMIVGMSAHGVRMRQPSAKVSELAITARFEHKMPVVGHKGISENVEWEFLMR